MKNKIISMLLILASLFAFCVPASAARAEEFISEVALIYEDSVEEARKAIEGTDWKLYAQDLNDDADYIMDDGVYLIYKTSTNVEDAITDLRVMDMYGGYSSANYQRQLEASRAEYTKMIADLRTAASEFAALYEAGDAMAALAKMQLDFYKDVKTEGGTETDMNMGDFFMNMPSDEQIVQVLFEGNYIAVSNLITLLAIGISGASESSLADRIEEKFAVKDTLSDEMYYDDAVILYEAFETVRAKLLRYDSLASEYKLTDDTISEDAFNFISEYAPIMTFLDGIKIDSNGFMTLAEFIVIGEYTYKDFYPIAAALTEGQMALVKMGQTDTVMKYGAPTASPEELRAFLDDYIAKANEEYDGIFDKGINVYAGVDRSIFKGSFSMTSAAERQQALTGETWNISNAAEESKGVLVAAYAVAGLSALAGAYGLGFGITMLGAVIVESIGMALGYDMLSVSGFIVFTLSSDWAGFAALSGIVAAGLLLIAGGIAGISVWYNYYNPNYTEIPNTLIDVRDTDLGDKYVKYISAKVFENGAISEKNADLNAYEGKEWNALYYTKDATAGNCLTPNFAFSETSNTVARRYQGVSMFGEDKAFNLNSNVFNSDAPGAYLTVRYSTTKKAAAEIPNVVGSMFAIGALYVLTAVCGAGLGVGGTLLVQKSKKKNEELAPETFEEI